MNWDRARQLLRLGRLTRDEAPAGAHVAGAHVVGAHVAGARVAGAQVADAPVGAGPATTARAPRLGPLRVASSVCVASGKGGTGKSLVCAALAREFAALGRTLVFDADLGCANAHLLHDVHPERSLIDVVEGRLDVQGIVADCGAGLALLPGGSGFARLAGLTEVELLVVARGIAELEARYRYLCVDSAAGLSHQTVAFAAASDLVLLVTTPDVTAITDAYAFLKVFVRRDPPAMPLLVVNRCTERGEAERVARKLSEVTRKFLGRDLSCIAALPEDRAAFRCTQLRTPVTRGEPDAPLAYALRQLARDVAVELGRSPARGLGAALAARLDQLS